MNAAPIVRGAMAAVPVDMKCTVSLRDKDGNETTGTAVGLPAAGGGGDSFAERTNVRKKAHTFSLLPDGLAFAPAPGMTIKQGTEEWKITAAPPINPTGNQVLLYRIVAER